MTKRLSPTWWLFGLAAVGLGVVWLRRQAGLSAPLVGAGDTEHLEWMPYFFGRVLEFHPWPQLKLFQDWINFPAGTTATYLPYSWESNYAVAALTAALGPANWSFVYFLASHAALFFLSWRLLNLLTTRRASAAVAFLIAFANVYAQNKFPRHANMAFCHWTSLTIVLAYTMLALVHQRRLDTVRRLLPAIPLLGTLSLGQDPGYLLPLCLTIWFVAFLSLVVTRPTRNALADLSSIKPLLHEWRSCRPYVMACFALTVFFLFLYLPLSLQVALDALAHPPVEQGSQWANPLRWLIPAFPYLLNPGWDAFKDVLVDVGDIELVGSPGWYFILAAGLGAFSPRGGRRLERNFLLTLLGILVLFHPVWLPTLKLFPWHVYSRNSARYSVALAPLLALLALPFFEKWNAQSRSIRAWFCVILLAEAAAQIFPLGGTIRTQTKEEKEYFAYVKALPGEALLEWPYCLTAWNQPPEGPCVARPTHYYTYNAQRFHGKKVPSADLGRASKRERAEWAANPLNELLAAVEKQRCFSESEWRRFLELFRTPQFAALELYPELLPKVCLPEWEKRLGMPTRRLKIPGAPVRHLYINPAAADERAKQSAIRS